MSIYSQYNYTAFTKDTLRQNMHFHGGPKPGQVAPDFNLPTVGDGYFRLSSHTTRKAVLLVFGSISCPLTAGSRSFLVGLFHEFGDLIRFVSVYTREAHPGENFPHHTSDDQKMRHACDWVRQDKIPWTVVVDDLDGRVHCAYDEMPNSIYLINRGGRVAFRALSAGHEALVRDQLELLLESEAEGSDPVILGESESHLVPMLHGAAEFEHSIVRAGDRAVANFRREAGGMAYGFDKLMSKLEPVINPGNRDIE